MATASPSTTGTMATDGLMNLLLKVAQDKDLLCIELANNPEVLERLRRIFAKAQAINKPPASSTNESI